MRTVLFLLFFLLIPLPFFSNGLGDLDNHLAMFKSQQRIKYERTKADKLKRQKNLILSFDFFGKEIIYSKKKMKDKYKKYQKKENRHQRKQIFGEDFSP